MPRRVLFKELMRLVFKEMHVNKRKPSYVYFVQDSYRNHLGFLRNVPVRKITYSHVNALKSRMAHLSAKTTNNVLCLLRVILKIAHRHRLIASVLEIQPLKFQKPRIPFFSRQEFKKVVSRAKSIANDIHAVVLLGGRAGLRRGEIIGLQWEDVDFQRGVIVVQRAMWHGRVTPPKGWQSREIPMHDGLMTLLQKMKRSAISQWVVSQRDGRAMTETVLYRLTRELHNSTGLERRGNLHVFRHTFCTHLAAAGVPVSTIRELAGHASLDMTLRYIHVEMRDKFRAIGRIG